VVVSGTAPETGTQDHPAVAGDASPTPVAPATAFPFKLPKAPGPHDSQALAVNTTDGGIRYDVAYSLVTVQNGDAVDETNSAYALASCNACTTVAVSFQLVLVVGRSDTIMPINVAEALNYNCPSCITTAIATQIVISLSAVPSDELVRRLTEALEKLDAIETLGASGSPEEVARQVAAVKDEIQHDLADSGLVVTPTPTPTPSATPTAGASATATPTATATPDATATPTPTPTPTDTATPTATATPTPTPTP
jgi:putative peptide zinc metalloprotease protein